MTTEIVLGFTGIVFAIIFASAMGARASDAVTLKDCVTQGQSKLSVGITIECTVIKDAK